MNDGIGGEEGNVFTVETVIEEAIASGTNDEDGKVDRYPLVFSPLKCCGGGSNKEVAEFLDGINWGDIGGDMETWLDERFAIVDDNTRW